MTRAAVPETERVVPKEFVAEGVDALAFYRDLFSRLEAINLDDKAAVSTSLGVRFVPDPAYEADRAGAPYRH